MSPPRCPRCDALTVEPHVVALDAGDLSERVPSTHRCLNEKCTYHLEAFRYTPPDWEREVLA